MSVVSATPILGAYQLCSKDIVFHMIFGDDADSMLEFIHAMAQRAYSLTESQHLRDGVSRALHEGRAMGRDRMRALFFMLLNMDMPVKEYICEPSDRGLFAAALNLSAKKKDAAELDRMHSRCMLGTRAIEPEKARRFFDALRRVVCAWMATEVLTPAQLVKDVREEYLVA